MAKHRMISFDVTSLFTKVPLVYTIKVILFKWYGVEHNCSTGKPKMKMADWCKNCLDRHDMRTLLNMATSDTHFLFNGKLYRQFNGVSMGSPLAPIIADLFMIHLEEQLLPELFEAGVKAYKRYVDDTFLLIDDDANIDYITSILNGFHSDIQFTSVLKKYRQLPFLDVLVMRDGEAFNTTVYRKDTFSGLLIKWNSYVPRSYKVSATSNIVYRVFNMCSTYVLMDKEFQFIKEIGLKNGYPGDFIDGQIRITLNRSLKKDGEGEITRVEQKDITPVKETVFCVLKVPYIGPSTNHFIKRLECFIRKEKPNVQAMIFPTPPPPVGQSFKNKDAIPRNLQSGIVYHINFNDCSSQYIGQTSRQVIRRLIEHGFSEPITGKKNMVTSQIDLVETTKLRRSDRLKNKRINLERLGYEPDNDLYHGDDDESGNMNSFKRSDLKSALARHELEFKHRINYNDWHVLSKDISSQRLKIKETLAIMAFKPDLNATIRSAPLIIFPEGALRKKKVKFKFKNIV